ncbi:uncharacterized protein LOC123008880 [Tribolium madens]|uniref:uncharacterized protein LOC123008880 n=1 Tax=Tribolium madens TaxID=41895 RepID=UPI001CF73A81|nr:uncharacterized protein LOC123008880 [Tribolium madens]
MEIDCFIDINEKSDKSTQTDFGFENFLVNNDEKLKAFTGISIPILRAVVESAEEVANFNNKKVKDLMLKVIIVLVKIRLNLPYTCLAILFNLSTSSVSRYFYSILSLLSVSMKPLIYWPTKEEIIANLPKCFEKYSNTRAVIDCTEIKVDRCKCLKCRILTYSHYKSTHTLKYLIAITPSGLISFVSSGYGGRTSDKAIFNKEKLIDKFDPHDGIMVDKGVLIEKECEENFLKLIRPPFLRKKSQFSKLDAEKTADIARARVHVERSIERMKMFHILQYQLSWYLVPYTDDIVKEVACLVNLSPPIMADDKFVVIEHFSEDY